MKKILQVLSIAIIFSNLILANGVILNKEIPQSYLKMEESSVVVTIENQVANTLARQVFKNIIGDSLDIKYAFPLPEGASATLLRYKINGIWYTASFAPVPQDTTTGGSSGQVDYNLRNYLGANPLFYNIDQKCMLDSTLIVELTYVQLLDYRFGKVNYTYPNNYLTIQNDIVIKQELIVNLNSERSIDNISLISHSTTSISNTGNSANLTYSVFEQRAESDYYLQYNLSLDELGLFALSTYIPDSLQKDNHGRGFFSFIVEPDPSENTEVIDKVFTLIIDNSGSMSGDKIVQARDASEFIVSNMNDGDKFNVISFSSNVKSFRPSHVEYNSATEEEAISYINTLDATGSTNISGAFDVAIPQFSIANNNTANIIIFFTDGEQTAGITNTDNLINHINSMIIQSEKQISLFTFGIGSWTNERLLTSIAQNNNGIAEFLENNELEDVITNFYLMIRNPVLLNTEIAFSPTIIKETYPAILPNLYKGQQMILVGRYNEASLLTTRLSGNAFTNDVEYTYTTNLSDSSNTKLQFLTKIWAKSKIDYLMGQYYLNNNNQQVADSIKNTIIEISLDYGVVSPFTSFQGGNNEGGGSTGVIEWDEFSKKENSNDALSNEYFELESIFPNPCHDDLNIILYTKDNVNGLLTIKLLDANGHLVNCNYEYVNSNNKYKYNIDLKNLNLQPGVYLISIEVNSKIISCKIVVK